MPLTAQQIAEKSSEALGAHDAASEALGLRVTHIAPGQANVTMQITEHMLNGHGICHGGLIFTLADTAFAHACNSYNQRAVAQTCAVSFLAPGQLGDHLTATARELHRAGRSGIYDIEVTRAMCEVIAQFRGHSRSIKGQHFEESQP